MIDLNNTVVHCQTKELAQKVLAKADKLGYKWYCGESFLNKTYWDCFKENTVYGIYDGFVSKKEHMKRDEIKIISAEEFLAEDFNTEQNNKVKKTIMSSKGASKAGLCSEERSMISLDYARNFICDFILGKQQNIGQLNLFS